VPISIDNKIGCHIISLKGDKDDWAILTTRYRLKPNDARSRFRVIHSLQPQVGSLLFAAR